jgi:hypothetical protein
VAATGDEAAPAATASTLLQGFTPLLEYVASQTAPKRLPRE